MCLCVREDMCVCVMCDRMYVCVCVCVCVWFSSADYIVCVCMCVCMYVCVCMCVCMCVCVYVCMYVCVYVCMCACVCMCVCVCVCMCVCQVAYLGNICGGNAVRYINLPVDKLSKFSVDVLKAQLVSGFM